MGAPRIDETARRVLEARYLRRRALGGYESPDEMLARVASAVAEAERALGRPEEVERWRDRFLARMRALEFLPNSPTLMNAGVDTGQLSACFVLPLGDSLDEIFEAVKRMALIQRTGGGTGFSFSALRPKGDTLELTGGESSGPVSFLRVFDCVTENVKLGGKRRGANLGLLRVDHPDVLEFVAAKEEEGALRNFNLSVAATDAFMQATRDGADYGLRGPGEEAPRSTLPARDVLDAICAAAWRTGDPGLVFADALERANPTPALGRLESTNPCGEVPLLPWESCNLGSIDLARMLVERGGALEVDWERLEATVRDAVRFLDDVIEVNGYLFPELERAARATRKLGLGVMGLANAFVRLGLPYDSDEALRLGERIAAFVSRAAWRASAELAAERGPFPAWPDSAHAARGRRVRNATCTAIAPTGTLSLIAGTSASIEPLFALAYRRVGVLEGETLVEVHPLLEEALERAGLEAGPILAEVEERGSLAAVAGLSDSLRRRFVTALCIAPERHLAMQAAFQRHVDNAVSKTVNLPAEAGVEVVRDTYTRAWELGLKGVTVFRYGSRAQQVLQVGVEDPVLRLEHGSRCDPEGCRLP